MSTYLTSVGMEVHAELTTESKMFCRCSVAFGGEPNTRVCPVCLGLPGALPVPNRRAVEFVLRTALALNCTIAMESVFHRKNYFYPDLPKGYQVSQYGETNPLGYHGYLDIPHASGTKRIHIRRVHLEEDTGKLMHLPGGGSGVDYNRAGVPLMEIVTDFPPDIENPEEAREYLVQLRHILLYLGVCDGKMEEGSLRCEPNISIRLLGSDQYGTKSELKNLNSFRSVQHGVQFEVRRQIAVLEGGGTVLQETRGWNEANETSFLMRTKESENDYRYFPCPDLVPMSFTEDFIEGLRKGLPELPLAKQHRYQSELGLTQQDAAVLTADYSLAMYFEEAVGFGAEPKQACNWITQELAKLMNESGDSLATTRIRPRHIVDITRLITNGSISGKTAKDAFAEAFRSGEMPSTIVEKKGATQISDLDTIRGWCRQVLEQNPEPVAKYRSGQVNVLGFLVGQVMKLSQGRANPNLAQELMRREIES
ncbi:MAG: Asp-tRNA(Asn)/Glu-tRNA(Gln) amidotransferase subunit GatB [Fimbriimonadaceae bacterium]|nr:Asp-tRNA(Asn)/Glu-tRNA(Gln) amidotransferase subunit GatB [Fimbriimonadaceae bacterium]